MKRSVLSVLFLSAFAYRMADDAPGAATTAEPVTITVAAEHASFIQRAVALLEKGEQFVVDNFEAGLTTLEGFFKSEDKTPPAQ